VDVRGRPMNRKSRKERERMFVRMGGEALKDHAILPGSVEGRWQIGRPGSGFYRAEIIVTYCNSLIVHGDVELVNFSSYSGPGGARGVVRWVAKSSPDYLATKAARGTGRCVAYCWDPDVALDDAGDRIEYAGKDPESCPEGWIEDWKAVCRAISRGDHQHEVQQLIYEKTGDCELVDIGTCESPAVMWAWLVVGKLHELLGGEE